MVRGSRFEVRGGNYPPRTPNLEPHYSFVYFWSIVISTQSYSVLATGVPQN
jgi:hypothetical protein